MGAPLLECLCVVSWRSQGYLKLFIYVYNKNTKSSFSHMAVVQPAPRTHNDSSQLQVSVFSSVHFRAEQDTDGNGRMARLPLLGGAPPR